MATSKKNFINTSTLNYQLLPGQNKGNYSFGASISVDPDTDTILVGAPGMPYSTSNLTTSITNSGGAFVFERTVKNKMKTVKRRSRQKLSFTTAGEYNFTVPMGVTEITLQMLGGAGGGNTLGTHAGGNGAFTKATISVEPGKTYKVIVGGAGTPGGVTSVVGAGGKLSVAGGIGGSGGGRSAFADIQLGDMITAGGGGGAGLDGAGGFGGLIAGNGTTAQNAAHAVILNLGAIGADRYLPGYSGGWTVPNYFMYGSPSNLIGDLIHQGSANGLRFIGETQYQGGDALPGTELVGNTFQNGAGGGGYKGGCAGPDVYGFRAGTTGAFTLYSAGGSGSGGSSIAEVTPAFGLQVNPYVRNVVTFDGNKRKIASDKNIYGVGGTSSSTGGAVFLEYDVLEETIVDDGIQSEYKQVAMLVAPYVNTTNPKALGDLFGSSVAIKGEWAFVASARNSTGTSFTNAGAVWTFRKVDNNWVYFSTITPTTRVTGALFGSSIDFNGTTLVVGSQGNATDAANANSVASSGAFYTFTFNGTAWVQQSKNVITQAGGRLANDNLGYKLALEGNTLLVSSMTGFSVAGDPTVAGAGAVWVYDISSGVTFVTQLTGSRVANAGFGSSISIRGNTISVEASGTAESYVYNWNGTSWLGGLVSSPKPTDVLLYSRLTPADNTSNTTSSSIININNVGMTIISSLNSGSVVAYNSRTFKYADLRAGASLELAFTVTQQFINLPKFTFEMMLKLNSINLADNTNIDNDIVIVNYTQATGWGLTARREKAFLNPTLYFTVVDSLGRTKTFDIGRVTTQQWESIAVVRDDQMIRTYVGGSLINSYFVGNMKVNPGTTNQIVFGRSASTFNAYNTDISEFRIRSSAAYVSSYTPDMIGDTPQLSDATIGTGTATCVIDPETIVSGAPDYSSFVSTKTANSSTVGQQYNNSITSSGKVDILRKMATTWNKDRLPLIQAGDFNIMNAFTGTFGTNIIVKDNKLLISSSNSLKYNSTNMSRGSSGRVYVYDCKTNKPLPTIENYMQRQTTVSATASRYSLKPILPNAGNLLLSNVNTVASTGMNQINISLRMGQYQTGTATAAVTGVLTFKRTYQPTQLNGVLGTLNIDDKCVSTSLSYLGSNYYSTATAVSTSVTLAYPTTQTVSGAWTYATNNYLNKINDVLWYSNVAGTNDGDPAWASSNTGIVGTFGVVDKNYEFETTKMLTYPGGTTASGPRSTDWFGSSVGIIGDKLVVGEPGSYLLPDGSIASSIGAVEIFEYFDWDGGYKTTKLLTETTTRVANTNYGYALDTNNEKLLIKTLSPTTNSTASTAYAFNLSDNFGIATTITGLGRTYVTGSAYPIDDFFNNSLKLFSDDSNNFVAGAPSSTITGLTNQGNATVFRYNTENSQYVSEQQLTPEHTSTLRLTGDFGTEILMDNGQAFIGAPTTSTLPDATSYTNRGMVYVYSKPSTDWTVTDTIYYAPSSVTSRNYGTSMSIKGDYFVMTGKPSTTSSIVNQPTLMFKRTDGKWTFDQSIVSSGNNSKQTAILMDPLTLISGNPTYTSGELTSGTIFLQARTNNTSTSWTSGMLNVPFMSAGLYDENITINYNLNNTAFGRNNGDMFGSKVRISPDKKFLAISSPNHRYALNPLASTTTNMGAVFVYYWDDVNEKWRLNSKVVSTTPGSNDTFGYTLETTDNTGFVASGIRGGTANSVGSISKLTITGNKAGATIANSYAAGVSSNDLYGAGVTYDASRNLFYVGSPGRTISSISSGVFASLNAADMTTRVQYNIVGTVNNRNANDNFGTSVSLNDGRIAVGTPGYSFNNSGSTALGAARGAVFTYMLDEGIPTFHQKITFENKTSTRNGTFVGISADSLVSGRLAGTSADPNIAAFELNGNVFVPTTVTNQYYTSSGLTTPSYSYDNVNKRVITNAILSSITYNFLNPILEQTNGYGSAFDTMKIGSEWVVQQNVIRKQTKLDTDIVEAGNILVTNTGANINPLYGMSGIALSPDGSMIAVAASSDPTFTWRYGASSPTVSGLSSALRGRVYVYRWNVAKEQFVYHSLIINPSANATTTFGSSISWQGDKLAITTQNENVYVFKLVDDRTWLLDTNASVSTQLSQAVLTNNGKTLVMGAGTSYGRPVLANSGAIGILQDFNGVWASSRGVNAGGDFVAPITSGMNLYPAGGGGGRIGGIASAPMVSGYPSFGGSNLVPENWTELVSPNYASIRRVGETTEYGKGGRPSSTITTRNGVSGHAILEFNNGTTNEISGTNAEVIQVPVPAGATSVFVRLWGAGGGATSSTTLYSGGAGGYVEGTLDLVAGDTLGIRIGVGGSGGRAEDNDTNFEQLRLDPLSGMGRRSTNISTFPNPGFGGGPSFVVHNGETIAIAAGGSGAASTNINNNYSDGIPGGMNYMPTLSQAVSYVPSVTLYSTPSKTNLRVANEWLGYKAKIYDNNRIFLGAPGTSQTVSGELLPTNSGSIHFYKKINGTWELQTKVLDSVSSANGYFGYNFDIKRNTSSSDIIALGGRAPNIINLDLRATVANAWTKQRYAVLTYTPLEESVTNVLAREFTTSQQYVTSVYAGPNDFYMGTPRYSITSTTAEFNLQSVGAIQVVSGTTYEALSQFTYQGSMWARNAGDLFGTAVKITGNTIFVGAPGQDTIVVDGELKTLTDIGSVYKFQSTITNTTKYPFVNRFSHESSQLGVGSRLFVSGNSLYAGVTDIKTVLEFTMDGSYTSSFTSIMQGETVPLTTDTMITLGPIQGAGQGDQPFVENAGTAIIADKENPAIMRFRFTAPGYSYGAMSDNKLGTHVYAGNGFIVGAAPGATRNLQGNSITNPGVLFAYGYDGNTWKPETKLLASGTNNVGVADHLGGRDNYIITARTMPTGNGNETKSSVQVFQRNAPGDWSSRGSVENVFVSETKDITVNSVALADSTRGVAGIPLSDGIGAVEPLDSAGVVMLLKRTNAEFDADGFLSAAGATRGRNAGDHFGSALSSSNSYVVVGSPNYGYDVTGATPIENTGAIWVYARSEGYPLVGKFGSNVPVVDGQFGSTVAIDNVTNNIAVSEPGSNMIHVYEFEGLSLRLKYAYDMSEVLESDLGAQVLGFANNKLAVGIPRTDAPGTVYVYDMTKGGTEILELPGMLDAEGNLMLNGSVAGDLFGKAVDLDTNGSLIVGAPGTPWDKNGGNELDGAGAAYIRKI